MKKRILIVDDDVAGSCLLKTSLERTQAYAVAVENNPTRTLETARWFHPELVLLDVVMPEMDGGDVMEVLTHDPELQGKVTVVFMTSIVSASEATRGPIGGFRYIAKPVRASDVHQLFEVSTPDSHRSAPFGGAATTK